MNLILSGIGNGNQKDVIASYFVYLSLMKSMPSIIIIIWLSFTI